MSAVASGSAAAVTGRDENRCDAGDLSRAPKHLARRGREDGEERLATSDRDAIDTVPW